MKNTGKSVPKLSRKQNPLAKLEYTELVWLFGILKDACRERLEKNLINQEMEDRLSKRGPIPGRVDPRPALKLWEPRYRKLLEVATEAHNVIRAAEAEEFARAFSEQIDELAGDD